MSSNTSEDTILCEITQSTSQQYLTSLDASQNITTSCEDTPCPVIRSTQEALIFTPNKPIITKMITHSYISPQTSSTDCQESYTMIYLNVPLLLNVYHLSS
ncbi:16412_t:CDS:2 [Entrophospora sp. SA101]|nr:2205_t:CDS:2 [Entrophospora sp. SA101]CAJ0754902.1 16412_t:CDS:2 [Entrophospora sp. SA101]